MQLEVTLSTDKLTKWRKQIEDALEVAAVRGWETAVELTPAAGETPYSTGQTRQSLRVQKTGDLEYTLFCPTQQGVFLEFGTGPKGQATGNTMPPGVTQDLPESLMPNISYHNGEVFVTRSHGQLLDEPYIRHTQGQVAQPFMRPALLRMVEVFNDLLSKM